MYSTSFLNQYTNFVNTGSSLVGSGLPALFAASRHFKKYAILAFYKARNPFETAGYP